MMGLIQIWRVMSWRKQIASERTALERPRCPCCSAHSTLAPPGQMHFPGNDTQRAHAIQKQSVDPCQ